MSASQLLERAARALSPLPVPATKLDNRLRELREKLDVAEARSAALLHELPALRAYAQHDQREHGDAYAQGVAELNALQPEISDLERAIRSTQVDRRSIAAVEFRQDAVYRNLILEALSVEVSRLGHWFALDAAVRDAQRGGLEVSGPPAFISTEITMLRRWCADLVRLGVLKLSDVPEAIRTEAP